MDRFRGAGTKINVSSRDGTLLVATSVDAKAMQCNTLCSMISQTFSWRWNKHSASLLDGMLRKGKRGALAARYASATCGARVLYSVESL